MADANSTIRVRIDGNATGIRKASADARQSIKGISDETSTLGSVAKIMAAKLVVGLAAVAIAAGVASPAIGAAIGGGIAIGAGAGIAALGIKFAAESERVKKAFAGVFEPFKAEMRKAAEPLEGVLVGVSTKLREFLASLVGPLDQAFADMAGPLDRFATNVFLALDELRVAIGPVTDAFGVLLDEIGPVLPGVMENIAVGMVKLADAVSKNPGAVVALVESLGMLIGGVLTLIGWLITLGQKMVDFGATVRRVAVDAATAFLTFTAHVLNGVRSMMSGFFGFQLGVLEAMRSVASALGLPTGPIDAAINSIRRMRGDTDAQLQAMITKTHQWIGALNSIPRTVRVNVTAAYSSTVPGGNRLGTQGVRAAGGATSPWSTYRVNELGTEVYSVRGRDYLMTGGSGGTVTPAHKVGGFAGTIVVQIDGQQLEGRIVRIVDDRDRELRQRVAAGGYRR